jgi:hypothetical protein
MNQIVPLGAHTFKSMCAVLTSVHAFTSAFAATKVSTTSVWPLVAALISAVNPHCKAKSRYNR